jgi:hypothetical protein
MQAKPLTDEGRRRIEAVLTPNIDRERFWDLFEHQAPPLAEREQISERERWHRRYAQRCRDLLEMESARQQPDPEWCRLLQERERWAVGEAEAFERAGKEPFLSDHYLRFIWAYEAAGGPVSVVTPYKPKEEAHYPEPRSEFVSYFLVAVKVILGRDISADTAKDWASTYRHMNFSAATLGGEGLLSVGVSQAMAVAATWGGAGNLSVDAIIPEKP